MGETNRVDDEFVVVTDLPRSLTISFPPFPPPPSLLI